MSPPAPPRATLTASDAQHWVLAGQWTAFGLGDIEPQRRAALHSAGPALVIQAAAVQAMDTAGAWVLVDLLQRLKTAGSSVQLEGLAAPFQQRLELLAADGSGAAAPAPPGPAPAPLPADATGMLSTMGRGVVEAGEQTLALLSFVGETALCVLTSLAQPARIRWRPILHNIRTAGIDALPIVGLLSFLLGTVVAYQAADQLRRYGANIFIADLVGLSMLREFAPLITAIIMAGRSGSAYAAQIGTMVVSEEIDALRTLGIAPLELLVLPKLVALAIAMPLLTVFADVVGTFGGMLMARQQLDVGLGDFLDRLVKAVNVTDALIGIGKAPVFAAVIATVGCFQGLRTRGGADSVGRQTTRAVVQSIFGVIVVDALFSVAFSALHL